MNTSPKNQNHGITLIEILIVFGMLMLLVPFALPAASSAVARAEIRAAVEDLQYSIRIARNTARTAESNVSLNLLDQAGEAGQRITFSASKQIVSNLADTGIQGYQFNKKIKFVSDFAAYEFDGRGIVKNPGQITLVSRADESVTIQVLVK